MWGCQTLALPSPPLQAQCMAQRPPWEGKARTKVYMYACVCVCGGPSAQGWGRAQHSPHSLTGRSTDQRLWGLRDREQIIWPLWASVTLTWNWVSLPWQRNSEKCSKVKPGEVPGTVSGTGQGLRRCQFPPTPLRFLAQALPRNLSWKLPGGIFHANIAFL